MKHTAVKRGLRGEASRIWEFLAFLHFAATGGRINHSLYLSLLKKKPIKLVLKNNSFYLLGCLKCYEDKFKIHLAFSYGDLETTARIS